MKDIEDKSVDMILCDLPYGTTACKWDTIIPFDKLWEQYERIIKDRGVMVLTGNQPFTSYLITSNIKLFKYELIWGKSKCGSPFTAKIKPMSKHENILIFYKNSPTYNPIMVEGNPYERISKKGTNNMKYGVKEGFKYGSKDGLRYPSSILKISQKWRRQDQLHPTQKPVALFEYLIKTYTNKGDLVLDNCVGSGTTNIACHNTNRQCIGMELSKDYCEIATKRLQEAKGQSRPF
jgi:site-specific DNA-methyltransferase (adenine-specific)